MQIALIGNGAIATYVRGHLARENLQIAAALMRPERLGDAPQDALWVDRVDLLPRDIDLVIDCAGHAALRGLGPDVLRAGFDLLTVSIGALADDRLQAALSDAATQGGSALHLASGAIGALDCLRAAAVGGLRHVRYTGRKPPLGWRGSPAEQLLDLDAMTTGAATHFDGTARDAAQRYPKNANVAAAVALAGLGFDETQVTLIADAQAGGNIHEIQAQGDFGSFTFRLEGTTLPDNPRSSALAAMSVVSSIMQRQSTIRF